MPVQHALPGLTSPAANSVAGGVIGAFDLFHVGHLRFLNAARQQCDHLKVGVGSDRLLRLGKGRAPVCDQAQRMEILQGLRCVNQACLFDVGLDDTEAAGRWLADWPVQTQLVRRLNTCTAKAGIVAWL